MAVPGLSDSLFSSLAQVRKAYVTVVYQGIDVTSTFQPSLKDFVYKEAFRAHCLADTLDIELADPEGLFRRSWSLTTGQTVSASIVVENWSGPGTGALTKPLGTMYIKSVRIKQTKNSGTVINISCTSIDPAISFRLEKKSRPWTATTAQDIVNQISSDNDLKPNYTPKTNPKIGRLDQHDHSDAVALQRVTDSTDFVPKIVNGQLWIRDRHEVETSAAVGTIVCPSRDNVGGVNGSGVIDWEFIETVEDANYSESAVSFKDNTSGNMVEGKATDPNHPKGPKLVNHHDDFYDPDPDPDVTEE